jgi:hypothetical protein
VLNVGDDNFLAIAEEEGVDPDWIKIPSHMRLLVEDCSLRGLIRTIYPDHQCPLGLIGHLFCVIVNFQFEWHLRSQSTRIKVRHSITLGCICRLRSIPMVSYMLLFHGSQVMQTSRFSMAKVPIDTCEMLYIKRFWNCSL